MMSSGLFPQTSSRAKEDIIQQRSEADLYF